MALPVEIARPVLSQRVPPRSTPPRCLPHAAQGVTLAAEAVILQRIVDHDGAAVRPEWRCRHRAFLVFRVAQASRSRSTSSVMVFLFRKCCPEMASSTASGITGAVRVPVFRDGLTERLLLVAAAGEFQGVGCRRRPSDQFQLVHALRRVPPTGPGTWHAAGGSDGSGPLEPDLVLSTSSSFCKAPPPGP